MPTAEPHFLLGTQHDAAGVFIILSLHPSVAAGSVLKFRRPVHDGLRHSKQIQADAATGGARGWQIEDLWLPELRNFG